jgi:hypothetical protein
MKEQDFHGPRPAAQWDSIPAAELVRLRRIEVAARRALAAYDNEDDEAAVHEAMDALMDAVES